MSALRLELKNNVACAVLMKKGSEKQSHSEFSSEIVVFGEFSFAAPWTRLYKF